MASRVSVVTGKDLAQLCRSFYPRWLNYTLYVMMELAVIGSDVQEVVGSAIALKLLFGLDLWKCVLITGCDTLTFLAVHYLGVRYLEALICLLISTMSICFFVNWGTTPSPAGELVEGWVVPTMQSWAILQAVSTVGAVIMPHNLYLHSGLVQSRKVNRAKPRAVRDAIVYNFIESAIALAFSFFVNLAVVSTFAGRFFAASCASQDGGPYACNDAVKVNASGSFCDSGCSEIGLERAGDALEVALGSAAKYIWGIGLLASGQAATMTATYAGQIIVSHGA